MSSVSNAFIGLIVWTIMSQNAIEKSIVKQIETNESPASSIGILCALIENQPGVRNKLLKLYTIIQCINII